MDIQGGEGGECFEKSGHLLFLWQFRPDCSPLQISHAYYGKLHLFYLSCSTFSRLIIVLRSQAPIRKNTMAKTASGRGAIAKPNVFGDDFRTSKRDKRQIKHAALVSKIEKNSQKTPKRRRASKKLVANLESLADALPEAAEENDAASQANVIKQKTLRHKPGALKRREKLEKQERDRFNKNLNEMSNLTAPAANSGDTNTDSNPTGSRWSALRNFISQTMEQQPVFKGNK